MGCSFDDCCRDQKMYGSRVLGLPSVSAVRISEASASRRLLIY